MLIALRRAADGRVWRRAVRRSPPLWNGGGEQSVPLSM
jgi:hypothetical protein